jgi:P27 family predicted phage terminase small subunit
MAKAGRKPKPTGLRILEGTKSRRKTIEPTPPPGIPTMPERLAVDPLAVAKWNDWMPVLSGMGVMTTADVEALATMCELFSASQACLLELRASGPTIHTDLGGVKPNPAGSLYRSLIGQLASLMSEFGLTPSSRTKVSTTKEPVKDDLQAFFAKHG